MYFDFKTPFKYRIETWLLHWIELFSSIVVILSFAFLLPTWGVRFVCWFSRRRMNKHHKKENVTDVNPHV